LVVYFNAASLVDSGIIFGALPSLYASNHLNIHKHHLSPETKPGNDGKCGVIKSFPLLLVNCKNLSSTIAHTT
jgi:hypothetical protein